MKKIAMVAATIFISVFVFGSTDSELLLAEISNLKNNKDASLSCAYYNIVLKSPSSADRIVALIVSEVSKAHDECAQSAITGALKDSDPRVVIEAVSAVSHLIYKYPQNSEYLISALADGLGHYSATVRENVASSLGFTETKNQLIHMALAERLKDSSFTVRLAALESLGHLKPQNRDVLLFIVNLLKDTNEHATRQSASGALRLIKPRDESVINLILSFLSDANPDTRSYAVSALGGMDLNNKLIVEALAKASNDSDSVVRSNASFILRNK